MLQSKKWVNDQRHIKYLPLCTSDIDDEFVDKWIKSAKWLKIITIKNTEYLNIM